VANGSKPHLVGINHVALEVGNVEEALSFYGAIFDFELRGSHRDEMGRMTMAFIDMGDQFLALSEGRRQGPDDSRHFGLVVDDRSKVRELAERAGAKMVERSFNFFDPWGNRVEAVEYRDIQFTKADAVLDAMQLSLDKSDRAKAELKEKGIDGCPTHPA
jgi:predicted enzyme related to lactoylglutathione lyase